MKELIIISGKGGTGKTSLTAGFTYLAKNQILCDADVDAADLHLVLSPEIHERQDFQGGAEAAIDIEKCTQCGLCRELCRWNAIDKTFEVDGIQCEGCGVCYYFCPENAIEFPIKTCGEWYISETRFGPMVHARLGIAEENSGKLVTLVRQKAKEVAGQKNLDLILTDGPPGIGCPVIASIGGASAVLIVAEPTVSGKHDMDRVIQLADHFKVPVMVSVNKADLNPEVSNKIKDYALERKLTYLGEIPFDPTFTHAMVQARTVFEFDENSLAAMAVRQLWEKIVETLGLKCV